MIDTEPAGNNISGSPSCLADRRTFTVRRAAVAACHSVRKFIVAKTELRTARRGQPLGGQFGLSCRTSLTFVTTSSRHGSVRRFPTGEVHTDRDYLPATSKYHRWHPAGCSIR